MSTTDYRIRAAAHLEPGDLIEMGRDPYAEADNMAPVGIDAEELAEVEAVEREDSARVAVHFTNYTSVSFPRYHYLKVILPA